MPDTYLRVVPVTCGSGGSFELNGSGEVADWLVEMRRLPTELTLDALFRLRGTAAGAYGATGDTAGGVLPLADAHFAQPEEYRQGYLAHVHGNLRELISVKHHLPRGMVERVHGFQLQLLNLCPKLFEQRVQEGRIVDGHGDLRPEHICFSDPIRIFDCIEFCADFRRIDVADELAFLAAECDFLGATWAGPHLIAAYGWQSGDRPAAPLLDFYKCYRACVRAKVAALSRRSGRGRGAGVGCGQSAEASKLRGQVCTARLSPLVIVVGGLAGTGKTTWRGRWPRRWAPSCCGLM